MIGAGRYRWKKWKFHHLCPVLSCSGQAQLNLNRLQILHRNFCNNQQSFFWESKLPQGLGIRNYFSWVVRHWNEWSLWSFQKSGCGTWFGVRMGLDHPEGLSHLENSMISTLMQTQLWYFWALTHNSLSEEHKSDYFHHPAPIPRTVGAWNVWLRTPGIIQNSIWKNDIILMWAPHCHRTERIH